MTVRGTGPFMLKASTSSSDARAFDRSSFMAKRIENG